MMRRSLPIIVVCALVCAASSLHAGAIYIDNVRGNDAAAGAAPDAPLKSFAKALERAVGGDVITLCASPLPYRDVFVISGRRFSAEAPLVIDGGGNWIIGTEAVAASEWQQFDGDTYIAPGFFQRYPKENFFLVVNGAIRRMGRGRIYQTRPLPAAEALKADEWTMSGNDLYIRIRPGYSVREYSIERPARETAFAFTARPSEHIIISNVNIKFVYNDGINLHCNRTGVGPGEGTRNILFTDMRSDWNFDEGISAHDRCEYVMSNTVMIGNNCGVVNIDWAAGRHVGVLIADSYDVDIMCYGEGYDHFEDTFVHSTRAFKNLKWEGGTNIGLVFTNSVFYFDPVNTNAFSVWANASSRIAVANSLIIDGSKKPLIPAQVTASGTVMLSGTTFVSAQDASEDMKRGASLTAAMQGIVSRYVSGELTGAGFQCVSYDTKPNALRLTFNYPVDALSLAGIRFVKDGSPFLDAQLRVANDRMSVIANNLAAGTYRIEITPMLLSVRGAAGCAPRSFSDVRIEGGVYSPANTTMPRFVRADHPESTPRMNTKSGIFIEAEAGELTAPMAVRLDTAARGGKCIAVPQGSGLEKGGALYRFEISEPGEYRVWLRTIAATSDDDSIFVSVDGGARKLFDIRASSVYAWDRVRDRIDGKVDMNSFAVYSFTAGVHTVSLMSREDGLLIDAVAVLRSAVDDPDK